MAGPEKSIQNRFDSLQQHLKLENPVLLDALDGFKKLDDIGYRTALLMPNESYSTQIPWWPLISILGTFSAGKSSFINTYLGKPLQQTGNQAVDDKFTVVCFGKDNTGKVLPGLALDADLRFPFYKISDEIERVAVGEGRRIDAYLQLKVSDSEVVRGKIIIDSPGFDADAQRTSTLKLTDHIIDISDLVLVFFDARHPEPGAMQDTLTHLVEDTIKRPDSNKFLYILNQIDTAAREDNPEDIVGAWQRALSQKGLTAGRFYTIFNKDAALPIENPGLRDRFEAKRQKDMAEIDERIRQVEVERAYRIVGSMEKEAYFIRDNAIPHLKTLKRRWGKRVLKTDFVLWILALIAGIAAFVSTAGIGSLPSLILAVVSKPLAFLPQLIVVFIVLLLLHFFIKSWTRKRMVKKMELSEEDPYINAFKENTKLWSSVFSSSIRGWNKATKKDISEVIDHSSMFVQKLNDQFTNPSGASVDHSI